MRSIALVSFVLLALGMNTQAITVEWYKDRNVCTGTPSQTYRVNCGTCVDPPFDWFGVRVSDIGGNQRVSMHNQDGCQGKSQVGQFYGPGCGVAGATALRSAWVAC